MKDYNSYWKPGIYSMSDGVFAVYLPGREDRQAQGSFAFCCAKAREWRMDWWNGPSPADGSCEAAGLAEWKLER